MSLRKLTVELDAMAEARALGEYLELAEPAPLANSMFEIPATGGWRIDAYYEAEPDLDAIRQVASAILDRAKSIAVEDVPDENWVTVSQAALPPVEAGRFTVHGSHDQARVGRRQNAILIDAGEAFGTAHHATTEGCLIALDRLTRQRRFRRVLDLGCGSGVLAIAAAQTLPLATVRASDIDPVAVEVARGNFRSNRLGGRIKAYAATGLAHTALRGDGRYDLVLANILAGPLIRLAPELARAIEPEGVAVLSGLLVDQAHEVSAAYRASGFRVVERRDYTGWTTLVVQRTGH